MKKAILFVIKVYKRTLSPILEVVFGKACRFTPTCSTYTIEALEKFGVAKGLKMGMIRLSKCHPWGPSGFDPITN